VTKGKKGKGHLFSKKKKREPPVEMGMQNHSRFATGVSPKCSHHNKSEREFGEKRKNKNLYGKGGSKKRE